MPTASINGFEMHYEAKGAGFPLVYVHGGFGGMGTGLQPEVPVWRDRFAEQFKIITYDRRASGRSSYPEEGFTIETFAKDVRDLLTHLGHDQAHIWGTSAGGQITLAFGLQYPEAASSLVIAESAPWLSLDEDLKRKLKDRIDILNTEGPEAAYKARATGGTVGLNLFQGRPPMNEEEQRESRERMEQIREHLKAIPREERIAKYAGELRNYSAYLDWDATDQLKELKPPAFILYGTEDSVFPQKGSRDMCRLIPNVEFKAFEGAEHGVVKFPESIDLILSFIKRHTPVA